MMMHECFGAITLCSLSSKTLPPFALPTMSAAPFAVVQKLSNLSHYQQLAVLTAAALVAELHQDTGVPLAGSP